ncbi:MOSC domain protein [Clostridiales bacterium oral taxon 876 str. F0540]|nr:MOSC domain protein [Clostridiales bacterium oral taxon 876 str. F0540]
MGEILALCISEKKGTEKINAGEAEFIENHGIKGDAHAGNWHRQVSLLSYEKIEEFNNRGASVEFGAFGENIVVKGIDLAKLPVGTKLRIGEILLEVTQIGKKCHDRCHIYYAVGDCIMPREGIFSIVLKGGKAKIGDKIEIDQWNNL